MGDITKNFDLREFNCKCGCGLNLTPKSFIQEVQNVVDYIGGDYAIITSGTRCKKHDKSVGGNGKGMHTIGLACDIQISKNGKNFSAFDIAEVAERLNFSGIGIIDDVTCHIDKRTKLIYENDHWFGNERTGNDNIKTFQRGTKFPGDNTSKITINNLKVILNGVAIIDKNF